MTTMAISATSTLVVAVNDTACTELAPELKCTSHWTHIAAASYCNSVLIGTATYQGSRGPVSLWFPNDDEDDAGVLWEAACVSGTDCGSLVPMSVGSLGCRCTTRLPCPFVPLPEW